MPVKSGVAPLLTRANLFMNGYLALHPTITPTHLKCIENLPEVPEGHTALCEYFRKFHGREAAE